MHDEMMLEEKKKGLKELIRQMYQLMAKGKADDKMKEAVSLPGEEPEEALEEVSDEGDSSEGDKLADKVADAVADEKMEEGDLPIDEKESFMKRGRNLPKMKGSMTVMKITAMKPKKKGKMS